MQALGMFMVAALPLFGFSAIQDTKDSKESKDKKEVVKVEAPKGAELGKPAPAFELKDLDGKAVKLSDFKDKIVVLEWFNPGCPFVKYAYTDGKFQDVQSKAMKDGVVWLSINSGAPGKEGAGAEVNKKARDDWKLSQPILIDESGEVGMKYGAKTTPHMFVIDQKGVLVYRGGLDNAPQGKVEGDGAKTNYVEAAIADIKANKPVATKETKSYGCSVKYGVKT